SYEAMVDELAASPTSKSLMVDSPGHAMAAGVTVNETGKTYYFYDPNFGYATFPSEQAMKGGLNKLFHDKKLNVKYKSHSTDPNKLEFKVSDHVDGWQEKNSIFNAEVKKLYQAPITPAASRDMSGAELKRNWEIAHAHPDNQALICYEAALRV